MDQKIRIGWKVASLNPALASLRYRAILPILALSDDTVENRIFCSVKSKSLNDIDILVIVKSFSWNDYSLACEAADLQTPVIFDLCDNIFIDEYKGKKRTSPAEIFALIAGLVSAVVVTTEPLANVVKSQIGPNVPVYVIPDGIETQQTVIKGKNILFVPRVIELANMLFAKEGRRHILPQLKNRLGLFNTGSMEWLVRRFTKAVSRFAKRSAKKLLSSMRKWINWHYWLKLLNHNPVDVSTIKLNQAENNSSPNLINSYPAEADKTSLKGILWFGNHGAPHADFGMLDLLYIRPALEKIAREQPVELIVVSNNREKYHQHIESMEIPSRYVEWNAETMEYYFQQAAVVVIPNSLDPFSLCKSSNRTVLALMHGVPVVATSTPALEALKSCIELDDFESGLRRYLTDPTYTNKHLQKGRQLIENLYGPAIISQLWKGVFKDVLQVRKANKHGQTPVVIVALQLPQDVDLAQPILIALKRKNIPCAVWTSTTAMHRWPALAVSVRNFGVDWHLISEDLNGYDGKLFPDTARILLSVTETNLKPHRFTHQLALLANAAGLFTATIQHGYENVGLTYSDDVHQIKQISFASQHIYLWGGLETLHPGISLVNRNKCIPIGCPKSGYVEQTNLDQWPTSGRAIIGIFENLHWHRYSEQYRSFFLEGVLALADRFPDVNFLVKPHNAGMWLTKRYRGKRPVAENLIIINPKDEKWCSIVAPQILSHLDGVISSPSTVALDAARNGLPVAVVAHQLRLNNYEPLFLIEDLNGWSDFVDLVLQPNAVKSLLTKSEQFVNKAILTGDGAARIADDMMQHILNEKLNA